MLFWSLWYSRKDMKKKIKVLLSVIIGFFIFVIVIGIYKFNLLQDDIYVQNSGETFHNKKFSDDKNILIDAEKGWKVNSNIPYYNGKSSGGNAYYTYTVELEKFPSEKMEKEVKEYIDKELDMFAKDASIDNDPDSEFFVKNDIEIIGTAKSSPKINSYILEMYKYTGGAHGNHEYKVFNHDKKTGKKLSLNDILVSNDSLKKLSALADDEFSKRNIGYQKEGASPREENWQLWYADGNAIVFIFPPYAIAPYAAGQQNLIVPVKEHPDIFKKEVIL